MRDSRNRTEKDKEMIAIRDRSGDWGISENVDDTLKSLVGPVHRRCLSLLGYRCPTLSLNNDEIPQGLPVNVAGGVKIFCSTP